MNNKQFQINYLTDLTIHIPVENFKTRKNIKKNIHHLQTID
jgi:hypothetical protein